MHTQGDFEWDADKAETNRRKHGISFADAREVFFDERAFVIPDPFPSEQRFVVVGTDTQNRILTVVYAWRGEKVRLISARRATSKERREYENG